MIISICNTCTVLAFPASGSSLDVFWDSTKVWNENMYTSRNGWLIKPMFRIFIVEQEVCFGYFHNINLLTFSWETLNEQSVEIVFSVTSDSKSFSSIFLIVVVNLRSPSNILLF